MKRWGQAFAAAALMALMAGQARAGEWEKLGERTVAFGADRDVIPVGPRGTFERIRLEVQQNGIEVVDLKVHFANGGVQDVPVRARIQAGGHTRAIDLKGDARGVEKVTVIYKTDGRRRRGRAHVVLWGQRAGAPAEKEEVKKEAPKQVEWVLLGERKVDFAGDRDVIPVTGARGTFRRIKLKVLENAIEVVDLKVHFGNGGTQDVQVRQQLAAGGETRPIDLPGAARTIHKIELMYRTKGKLRQGRALVKVFGLQEGESPREEAKEQPAPARWEHLGQRQVQRRAERDTILVTAKEGRFRKIKLAVRDNGIELLDLAVTFGDGTRHDVNVRAVIAAGGETRAIDLPGEARVIRKVELVYRSRSPRKGRATVHLFGM